MSSVKPPTEKQKVEEERTEPDPDAVFSYCDVAKCRGVKIDASPPKDYEKLHCHMCYEFLAEQKIVAMFKSCAHTYCTGCVDAWTGKKNHCPLCRHYITKVLYLNKAIDVSRNELRNVDMGDHTPCLYKYNPMITSLLANLNEQWRRLVGAIIRVSVLTDKYPNGRGLEILDLLQYRNEKRILAKDDTFARLERADGKKQVVFACLLPCMAIRLVITEHKDFDVGADNAYADEVADCVGRQLEHCWFVVTSAMNRCSIERGFVRVFDACTAVLFTTGYYEAAFDKVHDDPMRARLGALRECNFDPALLPEVRKAIPPLNLSKLTHQSYQLWTCCMRYRNWFEKCKDGLPDAQHLVYDEDEYTSTDNNYISGLNMDSDSASDSDNDNGVNDDNNANNDAVGGVAPLPKRLWCFEEPWSWVKGPEETDESEYNDIYFFDIDDSESLIYHLVQQFRQVRNKAIYQEDEDEDDDWEDVKKEEEEGKD